jgi:hypothetical protein
MHANRVCFQIWRRAAESYVRQRFNHRWRRTGDGRLFWRGSQGRRWLEAVEYSVGERYAIRNSNACDYRWWVDRPGNDDDFGSVVWNSGTQPRTVDTSPWMPWMA